MRRSREQRLNDRLDAREIEAALKTLHRHFEGSGGRHKSDWLLLVERVQVLNNQRDHRYRRMEEELNPAFGD